MAKYGINKVILVGNLGKDPEIRQLEGGISVANFSLATTERFRNREGNYDDRTEWHNIVMWRGLAETAAKYLKKGSTVYLEGRIVTRSWDGQDGIKKYRTEVEVSNMVMVDSRPSSVSPNENYEPPNYSPQDAESPSKDYSNTVSNGPDDLPF